MEKAAQTPVPLGEKTLNPFAGTMPAYKKVHGNLRNGWDLPGSLPRIT